jgi:hypothetical protein
MSRLVGMEQGIYHRSRHLLQKVTSKPTAEAIYVETGFDDKHLQGIVRMTQLEGAMKRDFRRAARELRELQKERKAAEHAEAKKISGNEPNFTPICDTPIPANEGEEPQ